MVVENAPEQEAAYQDMLGKAQECCEALDSVPDDSGEYAAWHAARDEYVRLVLKRKRPKRVLRVRGKVAWL